MMAKLTKRERQFWGLNGIKKVRCKRFKSCKFTDCLHKLPHLGPSCCKVFMNCPPCIKVSGNLPAISLTTTPVLSQLKAQRRRRERGLK